MWINILVCCISHLYGTSGITWSRVGFWTVQSTTDKSISCVHPNTRGSVLTFGLVRICLAILQCIRDYAIIHLLLTGLLANYRCDIDTWSLECLGMVEKNSVCLLSSQKESRWSLNVLHQPVSAYKAQSYIIIALFIVHLRCLHQVTIESLRLLLTILL